MIMTNPIPSDAGGSSLTQNLDMCQKLLCQLQQNKLISLDP